VTRCWKVISSTVTILLVFGSVDAATVSGYVREKGSGESMPFVGVYLEGIRLGAITNPEGYYAIAGVPPGDFTLVASLVGYKPYRKSVSVSDGELIANIVLQTGAIEVDEVTVRAERTKPSLDIVPSRTTLRTSDLKAGPVLAEPDPIRTLQTLPGILTLSDFNVGLYVRGGTPDQNLIRVDGAELYNVSHFFGLFSTFPSDAVKSAELLSGGYPAQYGGRLSSVLNIITDEGNKERFSGTGGISLLSSRLTLEGPVAKGSWLISGRRTYLEPILKIASKWNESVNKIGYHFYDVQGKTHQVLSHRDQVTFAFYFGDDYLRWDDLTLDATLVWGNRSISTVWSHLFSSNIYTRYQVAYSRFRSYSDFVVEDLEFGEWNKLEDMDAKAEVTWYVSEKHTIESGIEVKRQFMDFRFEIAEQRLGLMDLTSYIYSGYVQDSYRMTPYLSIMPGLRFNRFAAGPYNDVNPRLAARYQLANQTFLKASVGRYTQYVFRVAREFQGISFLSDLWFYSDSLTKPSHAIQYVAGIEHGFGSGYQATLEGYYKDYDALGEFNDRADNPGNASESLTRGDGRAYGMEIGLKKRSGKHTGWVSYSLGWSIRQVDGLNVDDNGVPREYYPKFDRRHSLNLVYGFDLTSHWRLSARYALASGQGYTPWLGKFSHTDPIGYTWPQRLKAPLNSSRLPYYSRLDFGFRGNYSGWGIKWLPFIEVINATNRANVYNRYWDEGDAIKQTPGQEKDLPQLPFLVTIGVDVEF
jgi:hypothetical protein